jgi:hypothetical protein
VPFFNDSVNIPWYGYVINYKYFGKEDEAVSNYTMHLFSNFIRWSNPTPYGYFSDKYYFNTYNPYNTYNSISNLYDQGSTLFSTTMDSFTRNLNITWQPMQPSNLTYLIIGTYPELKWDYRFDEAGFWSYYWDRLWEKRLTLTPTPALRNAVFSYQDSYILVWVFITVSFLLAVMLVISCFVICKRIKNDKYDDDEF